VRAAARRRDRRVCNGELGSTLRGLIAVSPVVGAGATTHAQSWDRDGASSDGFLLSDGLRLPVCQQPAPRVVRLPTADRGDGAGTTAARDAGPGPLHLPGVLRSVPSRPTAEGGLPGR
jgi:hypothetical protein